MEYTDLKKQDVIPPTVKTRGFPDKFFMRLFRKKFRPVKNLITFSGQSMTEIDYKLRIAIRIAQEECLGIRNIIPKKKNGIIVGYHIVNEGGETAVVTIE